MGIFDAVFAFMLVGLISFMVIIGVADLLGPNHFITKVTTIFCLGSSSLVLIVSLVLCFL